MSIKGKVITYTNSDGTTGTLTTQDTNTTYSAMKGATASAAGATGLVPAPAAGTQAKYLRGDGTWQTPPNTTYGVASDKANGLMSAADKAKLDGIAAGANNYAHPSSHPASMITGLAKVATSGSYNDLANKPAIPAAYSLPDATATVKGGVKIGGNITVATGTISLTKANVVSALGYTPPTTNTTYASMSAAEATTGTATAARTISAKVLHNKINSNLSSYATKSELATKANDNAVAHKTYAENISGAWSFTSTYGTMTTLVFPNADNTYNLGESDKRYKNAYAVTFHGALDGNAATATKLQTAHTINGTAFNGTANITTANWGTARNITITDGTNTSAAVSVNGSANVALKLPATIKANVAGNATSATSATNDSTGANIATSLANKQNNLGFTPVQQGGGYGQLGNKIYIGWTGSQLKCTVDSTDIGAFVFESRSQVGTTITAYYGPRSSTGNRWANTSGLQGSRTVSSTSDTFTPVVGQIYSGSQLYDTATPNGGVGSTGEQGSTPNVVYASLSLSGIYSSSCKYLCTTAASVNAKATVTVTGHTSYTSSGPHTTITGYSGFTKTVQGGRSTFLRVQ